MAEKTLYDIITDGGRLKPYSMPGSSELDGTDVMPDGALAVKCDEGLFLIYSGGHAFLYDKASGGIRIDTDVLRGTECAMPEDLVGWETEFSFAPGLILTARFAENAVDIGGEVFPLKIFTVGEKRFLLLFDGGGTVLFDAKRFLLYSAVDGRAVTGYAEVPAAG